jgi:hypothetical protein
MLVVVALLLLTLAPLALAQPGRPGQPGGQFGRPGQPQPPFGPGPGGPSGDPAAGCAGCACTSMAVIIPLGILTVGSVVLWVFICLWVAKDAKARGVDNPALWIVLILFTGVIGLIVYMVSRPQGDLVVCRECGEKRLRGKRPCPHCGY